MLSAPAGTLTRLLRGHRCSEFLVFRLWLGHRWLPGSQALGLSLDLYPVSPGLQPTEGRPGSSQPPSLGNEPLSTRLWTLFVLFLSGALPQKDAMAGTGVSSLSTDHAEGSRGWGGGRGAVHTQFFPGLCARVQGSGQTPERTGAEGQG